MSYGDTFLKVFDKVTSFIFRLAHSTPAGHYLAVIAEANPPSGHGYPVRVYMHVPDELRRNIADQLGGLLWKSAG